MGHDRRRCCGLPRAEVQGDLMVNDEPLILSLSVTAEVNMGDHAERVTTVFEYVPGETVEDLARRLFPSLGNSWMHHNYSDKITIKAVIPAKHKKDVPPNPGPMPGFDDDEPPF